MVCIIAQFSNPLLCLINCWPSGWAQSQVLGHHILDRGICFSSSHFFNISSTISSSQGPHFPIALDGQKCFSQNFSLCAITEFHTTGSIFEVRCQIIKENKIVVISDIYSRTQGFLWLKISVFSLFRGFRPYAIFSTMAVQLREWDWLESRGEKRNIERKRISSHSWNLKVPFSLSSGWTEGFLRRFCFCAPCAVLQFRPHSARSQLWKKGREEAENDGVGGGSYRGFIKILQDGKQGDKEGEVIAFRKTSRCKGITREYTTTITSTLTARRRDVTRIVLTKC